MNGPSWLRFWSSDSWREWLARRREWTTYQASHRSGGEGPSLEPVPRPPRPVSPAWVVGALLAGLIAIAPAGEDPAKREVVASDTTFSPITAETSTTTPVLTTTRAPTTTIGSESAVSIPPELLLAVPTRGPSGDPDGPLPPGAEPVTAVSITDGDTLDVVDQDGTMGTVRLIGINTPESNECFAREAAEVLAVLVPVGAQIGMTSDVSDVDQHDRLLRYLWVGGMSVNEEMVRRGAAISRRYQPDTAMADRLEAAQLEAKDSQLGLWAPEVCGPRVDASLSIIAIEYDPPGNENDNLNEEWVKIRNDGDNLVDLTGWTIKDESASNRYAFPILFALAPGESVTIHSGCGDDFGSFLYWCSVGAAVWNNDGDTVFLLDPNGNAHTTHSYAGSNPTQAPPTTVLGRSWIKMKVQFLISAANSGAQEVVFGRTIFTPGSRHEAHRHANAEEIQYVVRGRGIVIDRDEEIPVVAGDVVHTLRGQWHGFINTSETEDAEVIWAWAGASSRDTAGYEARH